MARYGQKFKDNAVARLLPPQSCPVEALSARIGIGASTLERWRAAAMAKAADDKSPAPSRWMPSARLDAVIATAAMDEASRAGWCREQGLYLADLAAPGSRTRSLGWANSRMPRARRRSGTGAGLRSWSGT